MKKRHLFIFCGSAVAVGGLGVGNAILDGGSGHPVQIALGAQASVTQVAQSAKQPAWPSNGRIADVEFSIVQSVVRPGDFCVKAQVETQAPDLICAAPADLARDGAIFGIQVDDGPVRVYGMAPLGTSAAALKGGPVSEFSLDGAFFQGTMAAGSDIAVDFKRPDGSVTIGRLGRP